MPNSFSTFFENKLTASVVNSITYELIIGSLDCSDEMKDLPSIKRETNKVVSENTTVNLIRSDAIVSSLNIQSFACINQPVAFSWGFVTDSGTDDTAQLLAGTVGGVTVVDDTIEVNVVDKNNVLSRILCNKGSAVSNYPSMIWWNLMTEDAGLSSVESSSNPDIDYNSWKEWYDFNDSEPVSFHVVLTKFYEDEYALDLQAKIMKLASAAVFHDGAGRLVPIGWNMRTSIGSIEIADSDLVGDIEMIINDEQLINKVELAFYNVSSPAEASLITCQNTDSVSSWGSRDVYIDAYENYASGIGIHEQIGSPASSLFVRWQSASLAATRMIAMTDHPDELVKYKIKTNISGIKYLPEDAITLVTSRDNLGSRDLTIRKVEYDLNDGTVKIELIGRSIA